MSLYFISQHENKTKIGGTDLPRVLIIGETLDSRRSEKKAETAIQSFSISVLFLFVESSLKISTVHNYTPCVRQEPPRAKEMQIEEDILS